MHRVKFASILFCLGALFFAATTSAQTDPGVRSNTGVNAGQPLASVSSNNANSNFPPGVLEFFNNGLTRFQEVEVATNGTNNGLGPRFNFDQCSGCHSQPAFGGSSPSANVFPNIGANPESLVFNDSAQVAQAASFGNTVPAEIANPNDNTIPSFITATGPAREARFPFFFNSNGSVNFNSPNGGVEDLYTITGRPDGGSCSLPQPSFATAQSANDIIFRIPTPVFGAGLIENLDDGTLLANLAATANNGFGISGTFNHNGNDGTISRFGWKAQNKSLELFAGEAYNVEMGITNEIFQTERPLPGEDGASGLPASCLLNPTPEDTTNFAPTVSSSDQFAVNASIPSDIVSFAMFMRLLAPPTPSTTSPGGASSISSGGQLFTSVGCATCHTVTIKSTRTSPFTSGLNQQPVNAFSDLEIHHMGNGLADNVSQGGAGGDQFRTAPLWGVGQRIFFLHDGRTSNILTAILDHQSSGSEANEVIENFQSLSPTQQQNVLNFLRAQ
jgi:CxxC motif-containing protein (DUF1111 family)